MNHSIAQSVAKNTAVMMGSQVITWLSSFILMLVLPRSLGSEEYGRLYLAMSLTMMFQVLIDFGGPYFLAKEIARDTRQASHIATHSIALRGVLWAASLFAMGLFSSIAGYSVKVTVLILILGFAKSWEGATRVFNSSFQGIEKMEYSSLGAVVERVVVTVAGVFALALGADAVIIALLMALSSFLNFSLVLRYAEHVFLSVIPRIRWNFIAHLMREGFPYFLYSLFAVIYYRVDAVMLSLMTSDTVTGWYGAAYRFFDVLMFLPSILSTAVFPVLSRLNGNQDHTLSAVTRKSLDVVILAGIPISISCYTFAERIIDLFFGLREYEPSVLLLRIFSVGLLLVYIDFVLGTTLFATDRQRQWTRVAFFALLLNPLLNYMFISYAQTSLGNGGIGSAIATLLTELFVMVMAIVVMPREIFAGAGTRIQFKAFAAGIGMGIALWLMKGTEIPWILQGTLGVMTYSILLVLFKAVDPQEIEFLQRFFSVRNIRNIYALQKQPSV